MKILVTIPANDRQRSKIESAAPEGVFVYTTPSDVKEEQVEEAEIILGNLDPPHLVTKAGKLRWIQLNSAGTEGYCDAGVLPEGVILTNATGAYGKAISEYMMGGLLMLRKKMHLYYANQLQRRWVTEGEVGAVEGNTVLIIGLGDIGSNFAKKMKAMGCRVIAVKRRMSEKPDCVDELYLQEEVDRLLPLADVVALSLPGNAETFHMLDRKRIGLLSSNAVVLNVGRGISIDTQALYEALAGKKIKGAYLDVTDPEPLPEDHPLWKLDNLILTPHISGGFWMPETLEQIVEIMAKNLERFVRGEEVCNMIKTQG